jgi:hypothetical protein
MTMMDDPRAKPRTRAELDAADRLAGRRDVAPAAKPPAPDRRDLAPQPAPPDATVASLGLPAHSAPKQIAAQLRAAARLIEHDGRVAIIAAGYLAARGWPTGTLGDGTGSRTSSDLTSVESAVIGRLPDKDIAADLQPGHWDGVDYRLAGLLRLLERGSIEAQSVLTDLVAHAQDLDPIPVGRGECAACARICDPARNSNDRLRSGFCNACRMAWDRAGRPPRVDWAHARRHEVRAGTEGVCGACKRPWTEVQEAAG